MYVWAPKARPRALSFLPCYLKRSALYCLAIGADRLRDMKSPHRPATPIVITSGTRVGDQHAYLSKLWHQSIGCNLIESSLTVAACLCSRSSKRELTVGACDKSISRNCYRNTSSANPMYVRNDNPSVLLADFCRSLQLRNCVVKGTYKMLTKRRFSTIRFDRR